MITAMKLTVATAAAVVGVQEHPDVASRDETVHRAWCGSSTVAVSYANSSRREGAVRSVRLNDREVPGAAEALIRRAAQRDIDQIEFLSCGIDGKPQAVTAVLRLDEAASTRRSMPPLVTFSIDRNGIHFA